MKSIENTNKMKNNLLPDFIELETSTYCNRKCNWCPNSKYKLSNFQKLISQDLFSKIIKDLKQINYSGEIALHGYNEPLFDPSLFSNISLVKKELPKAKIILFTNGDILTRNYCENLKRYGVYCIKITLQDAIVSNEPSVVLKKYITQLKLKKKIKETSNRLGKQFTTSMGWMRIIFYIPHKNMLTSRGGIISGMEEFSKSPLCFLPFSSAAIDYEGNMKICCEIYPEYRLHRNQGIVGHLKEDSFTKLWFSDFYNSFRKQILCGKITNQICSHCPKNGRSINWAQINKWKRFLKFK